MESIPTLLRFATAFVAFAFLLGAGEQTKPGDADAVIAGAVFRDPGYALPDATVTLMRKDDPKHKKLAQQVSTYRGEFVFHVPAAEAVYVVKASAKGYRSEEKEASVAGSDRVDLTFTLEPETKK